MSHFMPNNRNEVNINKPKQSNYRCGCAKRYSLATGTATKMKEPAKPSPLHSNNIPSNTWSTNNTTNNSSSSTKRPASTATDIFGIKPNAK